MYHIQYMYTHFIYTVMHTILEALSTHELNTIVILAKK